MASASFLGWSSCRVRATLRSTSWRQTTSGLLVLDDPDDPLQAVAAVAATDAFVNVIAEKTHDHWSPGFLVLRRRWDSAGGGCTGSTITDGSTLGPGHMLVQERCRSPSSAVSGLALRRSRDRPVERVERCSSISTTPSPHPADSPDDQRGGPPGRRTSSRSGWGRAGTQRYTTAMPGARQGRWRDPETAATIGDSGIAPERCGPPRPSARRGGAARSGGPTAAAPASPRPGGPRSASSPRPCASSGRRPASDCPQAACSRSQRSSSQPRHPDRSGPDGIIAVPPDRREAPGLVRVKEVPPPIDRQQIDLHNSIRYRRPRPRPSEPARHCNSPARLLSTQPSRFRNSTALTVSEIAAMTQRAAAVGQARP